jgi:hypothetical protein
MIEDSVEPESGWPDGYAYLYIDQLSVRPIETSYENDTFSARVFSNSSPEDYELAIKLVTHIARANQSVIEPEDNEAMDVERFLEVYDSNWINEHCQNMLQMLISMYKKERQTLTMSGTVRELKAGPRFFDQLLLNPESAFEQFNSRFRLLNYLEEHCYVANGIRLRNKAGDRETVISVYGPDVPTALSDSVDSISIRTGDDDYYVSIDQLADTLGSKAKWLSENVLLAPAMVGDEWQEMTDALKPVAESDVFAFAKQVEVAEAATNRGFKGRFTDEEWSTILYSPIVTFALVAGADGSIDKKEVVSFQKQMIKGVSGDNAMMQEVMLEVIPNLESLTQDVMQAKVDPKAIIEDVTKFVDQNLSSEEATQFKLSLMGIGKVVAESSGGFLGLLGNKISKAEQMMLASLLVLLKLA